LVLCGSSSTCVARAASTESACRREPLEVRAAWRLRSVLRGACGGDALKARRWLEAATDARDKTLETGGSSVDVTKGRGNETLDRARSAKGKLSDRVSERVRLRRDGGANEDDE